MRIRLAFHAPQSDLQEEQHHVNNFPDTGLVDRPLQRDQVREVYELPLPDLMFWAMRVHRRHHHPHHVQHCTLGNIKAGGCPEDCGYCPQSAHYKTGVRNEPLMDVATVVAQAQAAKAAGSTRFCMGAAWRSPRNNEEFERVLEMICAVRALGMEACVTLGMLTADQARRLKEAGLTAYNHNLDTSPEYYPEIISTHTYEDRLETLRHVRAAGIQICSGGIIGMGESRADRIGLLCELANLDPYPESVPINALVPVDGTPLAGMPPIDAIEMVRTIATARIIMPRARVRLAAGRTRMTDEAQAMCFLAGANSIFTGEKLLTTPNPGQSHDEQLLAKLGMEKEPERVEAQSPFVPLVELRHHH
jgi:biotin synthase